jgi:hypothetical protein
MAYAPAPVPQPPLTEEDFLRDRQRFWSGWCTFVVTNVVFIIVLLALMAIFLL